MSDDDASSVTRLGPTTAAPGAHGELADLPPVVADFRIIRLIGAGGMGAVYEAEQVHPRRTVALKVIKPGLATPEIRRRFEIEVQVLARLQHPGIAQIFQAGVTDLGNGPQPFFAMELVYGEPLNEWAEKRRLSRRERLKLIADVGDAVHHAHQRGVIHRDLKPGNILVAADTGQPKVLDFGVARATDADVHATTHTQLGQIIGTLPYMSPEQISGNPAGIDVRSDVYALGVVLFQLLAGRLPYTINEKSAFDAMHTIRDVEATRLTVIDRQFRGDVETIVAKALEKEKDRRYQSAAELSADIRRHLADEPIVARPPSLTYQLRKFARRNKAFVGGVAAAFVILAAGAIVSTLQAIRATRAERLAGTRLVEADDARSIAQSRATEATQARELADVRRVEAEASFARAEASRKQAEAQREANSALLYVSDLALAERLFDDGNYARGMNLLSRHQPAAGAVDRRHVEWFYLWRAANLHERVYTHPAFVQASDLSDDGTLVASGGADGSVRVWEVATGRTRLSLDAGAGVNTIALSPGAARVAVGQRDSQVRVYDVATARAVAEFANGAMPSGVRFAGPDRVGAISNGQTKFWDLRTSQELVASPGSPMVGPGGTAAMVISVVKGEPWLVSPSGAVRFPSEAPIRNMAISDGGTHAISFSSPGTLTVWDAAARPIRTVAIDRPITGWMMASAQGRFLAAQTAPTQFSVWNVDAGRLVSTLPIPRGFGFAGSCLCFSPSGALFALSGAEGATIYDVAAGRVRTVLRGHSARGVQIAFTPDEQRVITRGSDWVKVWKLADAIPVESPAGLTGQTVSVEVSRDGRWLASFNADNPTVVTASNLPERRFTSTLRLWTLPTFPSGAPAHAIELPIDVRKMTLLRASRFGGTGPPSREALRRGRLLSESDLRVLAGDATGRVHVWQPMSGTALSSFVAHTTAITGLASSADGTLAATSAGPDEIKLWAMPAARLLTTLRHPMVRQVAISPSGRLLASVGADGAIRLRKIGAAGEPRVLRGPLGQVHSVAFSPDERIVASGHSDGQIVLWDVALGRQIASMAGHTSWVVSLAFSDDGRRLVSASQDALVVVWDVATRTEVLHLRDSAAFLNSVALLPDRAGIVAGGAGGATRTPLMIWRAAAQR